MPASVPGAAAVEHDDLALARGVAGIDHRLAVEAHVGAALGDQAVRLARHDERVGREADVQRLTAAPLGEQQAIGIGGRLQRDRDRALERRDGRAERLDRSTPAPMRRDDERGDHLGVGRDLGREVQPVERLQVGVVVDVAVERGDRVTRAIRRADRRRRAPLDSAGARSASEMMPMLAQRVCASTEACAVSARSARCNRSSSRICARAGGRCCRRAHRSRPRSCRRTRDGRRACAPNPR